MSYKKRQKAANPKLENSAEPVVETSKSLNPVAAVVVSTESLHPDTKLLDFMEETLRRSGLSGRVFIKYHHERGFTMREIMPHEAFESHGSVRAAIVALKEKLDPDPKPTA